MYSAKFLQNGVSTIIKMMDVIILRSSSETFPNSESLYLGFASFQLKEEATMGEGTDLQITGASLLSGIRSEEGSSELEKHDSCRSHKSVTTDSFRKLAAPSPSASQYDKSITVFISLLPPVPIFLFMCV